MTPPTSVPLSRRALASLSLGASAVGYGVLAARDTLFGGWTLFGFALLVGAGAVGLSRRGIVAQVLSRGVAWVVLTPMLLQIAETARRGRLPGWMEVFFAATSAGALMLARPALHTPSARAEFDPVSHRRPFLAGAVAAATVGLVAGLMATQMHSVPLAALAGALLASAMGVARMRSWGVLLALGTSLAALAAAVVERTHFGAMGLASAAIPGFLLGGTLLAARFGGIRSLPPASPRAIATSDAARIAVRMRVAASSEPGDPEDTLALPARVAAGHAIGR